MEVETKYIGETGRTIFDRGLEHLTAHRKRNPESTLVEHEVNAHQGEMVEWKMEPVQFIPRNLLRQATEDHFISNQSNNTLVLNRKGEWG